MRWLVDTLELTTRATGSGVLPLAILSGLALGAVAVSFLAMFRAKELVRTAEHRSRTGQLRCESTLKAFEENLNALTAQLREMRLETPVMIPPGPPKPGLNLTKRSQALRMHRRGDPPDQIATVLQIPLQEVDLLLKVQRIVISNI